MGFSLRVDHDALGAERVRGDNGPRDGVIPPVIHSDHMAPR